MTTIEEVQTELARLGLRVEPAVVDAGEVGRFSEHGEPLPAWSVIFPDVDGFGGGTVYATDLADVLRRAHQFEAWRATRPAGTPPTLYAYVDDRMRAAGAYRDLPGVADLRGWLRRKRRARRRPARSG